MSGNRLPALLKQMIKHEHPGRREATGVSCDLTGRAGCAGRDRPANPWLSASTAGPTVQCEPQPTGALQAGAAQAGSQPSVWPQPLLQQPPLPQPLNSRTMQYMHFARILHSIGRREQWQALHMSS